MSSATRKPFKRRSKVLFTESAFCSFFITKSYLIEIHLLRKASNRLLNCRFYVIGTSSESLKSFCLLRLPPRKGIEPLSQHLQGCALPLSYPGFFKEIINYIFFVLYTNRMSEKRFIISLNDDYKLGPFTNNLLVKSKGPNLFGDNGT